MPRPPRHTLYTLGYQQRTIDEYVAALLASHIDVLIDVRETPWSHKPGFSKGPLERALAERNIQYVHAKFAGNPKRLRDAAQTHKECLAAYADYLDTRGDIIEAFEQLVTALVASGKRVCITCFERHPDDCHRSILAERWVGRGARAVAHLAPEGCKRLIA